MSDVRCHFSFLFWTKWWGYLVEGLVSTGPTLSSFEWIRGELDRALQFHCKEISLVQNNMTEPHQLIVNVKKSFELVWWQKVNQMGYLLNLLFYYLFQMAALRAGTTVLTDGIYLSEVLKAQGGCKWPLKFIIIINKMSTQAFILVGQILPCSMISLVLFLFWLVSLKFRNLECGLDQIVGATVTDNKGFLRNTEENVDVKLLANVAHCQLVIKGSTEVVLLEKPQKHSPSSSLLS